MHFYFINAGVEGTGDVCAVQLITKFGSLENLLQCVYQVEEERTRKALITFADQAVLSKNLVIIIAFSSTCYLV
ncbi:hypothetical protein CISIN_1g035092mg [Citrus sinensis]|uniref:5'-3' exonuclease domain-containing protein n=1 Tax=Citrus sinensis TaxID=2711 RepID=A0A067FD48_CITSI|nr:hypothetical protein CISIN_1g035092mg [Citrus sinensis]